MIKVLLVEDDAGDALLLGKQLRASALHEFSVYRIERIAKLAGALQSDHYDVILLDLTLPDSAEMDTLEVAVALAGTVPIIVMTGIDDEQIGLQAISRGAQDFVVKGSIPGDVLVRAIIYAIERRRLDAAIRYASLHDPLTGLANRSHFFSRLEQAIHRAVRRGESFCVAYLDLDGFKAINDRYGHPAGDEVLQTISRRIDSRIRGEDTLARLGGDEFACIFERVSREEEALPIIEDLHDRIVEPVLVRPTEGGVRSVNVGVSVGLAFFPRHGRTVELLISAADAAMYRAKSAGGNAWKVAEER